MCRAQPREGTPLIHQWDTLTQGTQSSISSTTQHQGNTNLPRNNFSLGSPTQEYPFPMGRRWGPYTAPLSPWHRGPRGTFPNP